MLRRKIIFYFLKRLGLDVGRTQGYLDPAQAGPKSILGPAQLTI